MTSDFFPKQKGIGNLKTYGQIFRNVLTTGRDIIKTFLCELAF